MRDSSMNKVKVDSASVTLINASSNVPPNILQQPWNTSNVQLSEENEQSVAWKSYPLKNAAGETIGYYALFIDMSNGVQSASLDSSFISILLLLSICVVAYIGYSVMKHVTDEDLDYLYGNLGKLYQEVAMIRGKRVAEISNDNVIDCIQQSLVSLQKKLRQKNRELEIYYQDLLEAEKKQVASEMEINRLRTSMYNVGTMLEKLVNDEEVPQMHSLHGDAYTRSVNKYCNMIARKFQMYKQKELQQKVASAVYTMKPMSIYHSHKVRQKHTGIATSSKHTLRLLTPHT
jgi:hypothetical protein